MASNKIPYIKSWSDESDRILRRITKNGKAWTKDKKLPLEFGMRCKDIDDFLDIAEIRQRRKEKETVFVTKDNTVVIPRKKKYFFYKIL